MKTKSTLLNATAMMLVLSGCDRSPIAKTAEQCISLPATSATSDRDVAAKFAAELKNVPIDGDLETTYRNKAAVLFDKVSETNTALIILIQGAHCLTLRGADPKLAEKLIDAAYKLALARFGVAGAAADEKTISATARQQIQRGANADEVLGLLKEHGYHPQ